VKSASIAVSVHRDSSSYQSRLTCLSWRARPIGPNGLVKGMPRALRSRYACSMMPHG
jgi:hypothetical protein